MNVLILSAGPDLSSSDDSYPLCLTEFNSVPLIQRVINSCNKLSPEKLIVLVRKDDVHDYHLDNVILQLTDDAIIIAIDKITLGAACSALLAVEHIDNNEELLIVNGNEFLDADFKLIVDNFRNKKIDAGVVIFESIHPRYSYVALDQNNLVVEASEKNPISNNATAGFYWFKMGAEFVESVKSMIKKDARVNGKFFICPSLNELILKNGVVGIFPIQSSHYHPLKTTKQIEQFEATLDKEIKL